MPDITVLDNQSNAALVSLGTPVLFRDLQLVPITLSYPSNPSYPSYANLRIRIPPGPLSPSRVTRGFAELYQHLVLNPPELDASAPEGYLIIVPDAYYDNALALARWKEQKGYYVTLKRKSEVGSTADQIRDYIATAYHTWPVPPEYVLLAGNAAEIPTFTTPRVGTSTDQTYACIDGNDFLPEVLIGRLPVNSGPMLDYLTQKIFNYERTPFIADTSWFRRAMMISTIYQEGGTPTVTALATKRWVRDLMLLHDFRQVDTVFDPPYHGSGVAPVDSSVDKGVCFINGRGWGNSGGWNYPPYRTNDIQGLDNGWKQPVITSLYCGTAAFQSSTPCFGEAWLQAGSPAQPRGAVAFFGPSWLATSTRWNNCLDYGIYHGILNESITTLAEAMLRGKLEVFRNFPMACDSYYLRAYFFVYNLLGDPSLQLWTGSVPQTLTTETPAHVPIGTDMLTIRTAHAGDPLPHALVSLVQGATLKAVRLSDASGQAVFANPPLTGETLFITVTKSGYLPSMTFIIPAPSGEYVAVSGHSPGSASPGATIPLTIQLKNYGSLQTAPNVTAYLRSTDPLVTISDSIRTYGDIGPDDTASSTPFVCQVAPNCTSGHILRLVLHVTTSDSQWNSALDLPVSGAKLSYRRHTGLLSPGQTHDIALTLRNDGLANASNVTGTLASTTSAAIIEDPNGTFGDIPVRESTANTSDQFRIRVEPGAAPGRTLTFDLTLRADEGLEQLLHLDMTVEPVDATAPLGPDAYGYYAYDDVDTSYSSHPSYSWFEIDPNHGGPGALIPLRNDDIRVIPLPFIFRHYGQDYSRISVTDNGFLTCDSTPLQSFYNWRIPSAYGPPAIIAPFWDDFRPDTLGASGVYQYYDQHAGDALPNHRLIIEWSRVVHVHGFKPPVPAEQQTFQAILYDPAFVTTPTGDGEILFQYQTVFNDDSNPSNCHNRATVGIANREHDIGLQCTFADSLAPACADFVTGRAIKFTTNRPDTFTGITEKPLISPLTFALSPLTFDLRPNPARGLIAITYSVPPGTLELLSLFDVTGRLVRRYTQQTLSRLSAPGPTAFSAANLPPGIYLVSLTLNNSGRIIIAKRKLVVAP
jgi:hypothetical protein